MSKQLRSLLLSIVSWSADKRVKGFPYFCFNRSSIAIGTVVRTFLNLICQKPIAISAVASTDRHLKSKPIQI